MKIETEIVSPIKGVVLEVNCAAGKQADSDNVVAILEGYEEIQPEAVHVEESHRAKESGIADTIRDPSNKVWCASEEFLLSRNVNDGILALPRIQSVPTSQLNNVRAQTR